MAILGSAETNLEVNCMVTRRGRLERRRRIMRIAVPLAIPLGLALVVGAYISLSSGGTSTVNQTAAGASPGASAPDSAGPSSTAVAAAPNVNCDIIVPANPLTAQGLATPYQLTGTDGMSPEQSGCTMANAAALGAFVQATILNTQTGQLYVYDPLVI